MMRASRMLGWGGAIALSATVAAQPPGGPAAPAGGPDRVSTSAIRAHVAFLADDLLEGRAAGTRGYDLAARYVAAQLATIGLQPAGDDGTFFQAVPLLESTIEEGTLSIRGQDGAARALAFGDDFLMTGGLLRTEARVEAPVVFVGFGVEAPEHGHDDYAGRDVRGRIVAVLSNAPTRLPSEQRAYHASGRRKAQLAARKGAIGLVSVRTREDERLFPWARMRQNFAGGTSVDWVTPAGVPAGAVAGIQGGAMLSASGAAALFEGAPTPLERVLAEAETGAPAGFDLPVSLVLTQRSTHRRFSSANVVGKLPGADATLAGTAVVYSAHLDHVGVGMAVDGDDIYNGAYDNGVGVGALIETARALASRPRPPARSIVFAFVTAEEKGLVGSDYFAANPPAAAGRPVANVNMDMPLLLFPIDTVIAFGAEHSTLGGLAARAAAQVGLKLIPDPMPEQTLFVRSDQYSFVRQGIPAVFLVPGFSSSEAGVDGPARFREFLATHYHQPSDEVGLPLDDAALERFTRANMALGYLIATEADPPRWHPDSFFGRTFDQAARAAGIRRN